MRTCHAFTFTTLHCSTLHLFDLHYLLAANLLIPILHVPMCTEIFPYYSKCSSCLVPLECTAEDAGISVSSHTKSNALPWIIPVIFFNFPIHFTEDQIQKNGNTMYDRCVPEHATSGRPGALEGEVALRGNTHLPMERGYGRNSRRSRLHVVHKRLITIGAVLSLLMRGSDGSFR